MNGSGFNRTLLVAALIVLIPAAAFCGTPQVDLKRVSTKFDHWHSMASGEDFIYLDNTTWGAFFIYWGPVPETMPKNIDEAFVLETVTRFHGEPCTALNILESEKVKVHGHKGFSVTGMIEGEDVHTSFTVFQCNKSDRLFLTQIDLHTACGTPVSVSERLAEVERTISCHGVNRRINNPKVPMKMNFPAIHIVFFIPDGWRSDIYQEGSTAEAGAVWTLPINSDDKIYYATVGTSGADPAAAAASVLEGFRAELLKAGEGRTVELNPEGDGVPVDLDGRYLLKGSVMVKDEAFAWDSGEHLFRLQIWERGGNWHCLLYSILSRNEFEGRRVYLQPDDSTFLSLEERLAKAVDGFQAP
jgi:hypothetical protein